MPVAQNLFALSTALLAGSSMTCLLARRGTPPARANKVAAVMGLAVMTMVPTGLISAVQHEKAVRQSALNSGRRALVACDPAYPYGTSYRAPHDLPVQHVCQPAGVKAAAGYKASFCAARPFATLRDGRRLFNCRNDI